MQITKYDINTKKITNDIRVACVSDVHGRPASKVIEAVRSINPDLILLAGDIMEISAEYMQKRNKNALSFLGEMSKIAPCYYCFGNHELYFTHAKIGQPKISDPDLRKEHIAIIEKFGIHLINDTE